MNYGEPMDAKQWWRALQPAVFGLRPHNCALTSLDDVLRALVDGSLEIRVRRHADHRTGRQEELFPQ
jgi:hypothetical protein